MQSNAVQYGDQIIPGQQAQSPAGKDHIAFRPACDQLGSSLRQDGKVEWSVTMPDSTIQVLAVYDNMGAVSAHTYLDAEGLCKVNGQHVPIVYSDQVPAQAVASAQAVPTKFNDVAADIQSPGSGGGVGSILVGALFIGAIAFGFVAFTQRKPKPKAEPGQSQAAKPAKSNSGIDDLINW